MTQLSIWNGNGARQRLALHDRSLKLVGLLCGLVVALLLVLRAHAQSNITFQYFYDDLGQLTKVADSTGTVIEYFYDPVGNILQIKRSNVPAGTLALFNFTPQRGGAGQTVTIQGQAFDPTPANDIVQFNGTPAAVLSATATTLTAVVPDSSTTGPISLTVAGQTVTTASNFTLLPVPIVTFLSRKSALLGASFPNPQFPGLTVIGANLADSIFSLAPTVSPPAVTFGFPQIDSSGTSAIMSLNVGTTTAGTFAVVATNFAGSSSAVPTKANRFTIVDPRSLADTDGDGIPDAIEAIYGSDPLDPASVPVIVSAQGQAESPSFTILNNNSQRNTQNTLQGESAAFTILNSSAVSPKSVLTAQSALFTVENSSATGSGTHTFNAESPLFTIENPNPSGLGTHTFATESSLFSLLNRSGSTASTTSMKSRSLASHHDAAGCISSLSGQLAVKNLRPAPQSRARGRRQPFGQKRAHEPRKLVDANLSHKSSEHLEHTTSKNEMKTTNDQGVAHDNQNR